MAHVKGCVFDVMRSGEKLQEFRLRSKLPKRWEQLKFIRVLHGYTPRTKPWFVARVLHKEVVLSKENLTWSNGLEVELEEGKFLIRTPDGKKRVRYYDTEYDAVVRITFAWPPVLVWDC